MQVLKERFIDNLLYIHKFEINYTNFFWLGYIVYSVSYTFISTGYVSFTLFQMLQGIGIVVMILSAFKLLEFNIDNQYLKGVFSLFMGWIFIMILSGYNLFSNYDFLKKFLLNQTYGGMLYLAPLILLFPKKLFI